MEQSLLVDSSQNIKHLNLSLFLFAGLPSLTTPVTKARTQVSTSLLFIHLVFLMYYIFQERLQMFSLSARSSQQTQLSTPTALSKHNSLLQQLTAKSTISNQLTFTRTYQEVLQPSTCAPEPLFTGLATT